MSLTKNHAVPFLYVKGDSPRDKTRIELHLHDELRKLEASLRRLNALIPQAAAAEPSEKFIGMQRYALAASWDPLSGGIDKWVFWDGSNWVAL
jgi:hypothetical protein